MNQPTAVPEQILIRRATARFTTVDLDHPLVLAGGTVRAVTMARVRLAADGPGRQGPTGVGASMLSVPWSWPGGQWAERDAAMRSLVTDLTAVIAGQPLDDPFRSWLGLCRAAAELAPAMPALARLLCAAAVDNALHDLWSLATTRPLAELYRTELLGGLLTELTGAAAQQVPVAYGWRTSLPVQFVLGLDDPLDALRHAIRTAGVRHAKVKLAGHPDADRARIAQLTGILPPDGSISLDPNEGYRDVEALADLWSSTAQRHPEVWAQVRYAEQPVPRDGGLDLRGLHDLPARVPVLLDEGLTDPAALPGLFELGWDGLVVKASKGQSHSVLCHVYARAHSKPVVLQDLTAVDLALVHSAGLAAMLPLDHPAFECNSLQYAPAANHAVRPALTTIRDGRISVRPEPGLGLYGGPCP